MTGDEVAGERCQRMLADLPEIENVCVFMADALRWDHLPDAVAERGLTYKTVAASLTTHTSLPSMLSGLWPHRHGVLSWQHRMPDVPTLLTVEGLDDGYYMPGDESVTDDGTFAVLGRDERRALDDLEAPWTYFERHHGGHAPFNAAGWEGSWEEFVDEFAGDSEKHRRWYRRAVEGTVEDFEERLATIRERGEEAETLVVFTSDHGEYLGEDGLVDHTSPMRPETVHVPTVFVHPDLDGETRADHVMRHVDLLPTVLDVLGREVPEVVDGQSLLDARPTRGYSMAANNLYLRGEPRHIYRAAGVWDTDGGWVRNATPWHRRGVAALGLLAGSRWQARHMRRSLRNYPGAAAHYLRSRERFGDPSFTYDDAAGRIEDVEAAPPLGHSGTMELSDDTEERLHDLGYL